MDWRVSCSLLGTVVKFFSLSMLLPLLVAIRYGEDVWVFAVSLAIGVSAGLAMERLSADPEPGLREALLLVSLSWLAASLISAIPFFLAGQGTASTLANPVNALFEATSGVTTTGATVLGQIGLERHSHAVMLWRQLIQWLGGMGIIVLMIAILPEIAVNGAQLMQNEAPGPELQKLTPRIAETARALWLIYVAFTLLLMAILYGLHLAGFAPNMDLYNAIAHGFSTLPTGGFSPQSDSIAAFSAVVQWVFIPFMIVAGVNFALFWHVLRGEFRTMLDNAEFRTYAGAIAVITAVLAFVLYRGAAPPLGDLGGTTQGITENALRQAAFQIASLLNSTGFATSNFAQWGPEGRMILLFAMFIGGSAGSTGGGIKVVRWLVTLKVIRRELYTTARPDVVRPVRLGGRVVDEDAIRGILVFTLLYFVLMGVSAVFLELDSARIGYQLSTFEAFSAALATIGNIGPGFGSVGPFGSYLQFSPVSKLWMTFLMWAGRLEIVPVLALLVSAIDDSP
ncbi:TrkH family potassium uptake protein [Halorientalis halophila]|uniref:TrkH family potassium uptake protein n=1 Tax=Halorientalis halophila TaxID=3108499 RepID=UPI0030090B13